MHENTTQKYKYTIYTLHYHRKFLDTYIVMYDIACPKQ